MISLHKGPVPNILQINAEAWTQAVVAKVAAGIEITAAEKGRYRHQEIKTALLAETHDKCAYCESKVRHIAYGDIEHIVPKSNVPERWFDWTNLTIACDICNTRKSDFHGGADTFIDPYLMDPTEHLRFIGPLVIAAPGSNPGAATERILDLNRAALVERRTEKVRNIIRHLDVIARTPDADVKELLLNDFQNELSDEREYAAVARATYVASLG
ncbi:HNH endonuclease [Pseudokordiimonas caeni]|uniref:HNH endonuclease n=1 Tax=Pseudokordiimonas caeni TaxID=2997908 RepID=UPI0028113B7F|nr:HNH endonuclease [Pseudokordiimonas caeni]